MKYEKNVWMWISAALLCTTIIAAYMALDYQSRLKQQETQYQELLTDINVLQGSLDELTIIIDMKIDYGNDTIVWFNDTRIPLEADLLTATQIIASVEFSEGDFGAFITKINEVSGDVDKFWLWHYYETDSGTWQFGPVACDAWILHSDDVVSWVYSGF